MDVVLLVASPIGRVVGVEGVGDEIEFGILPNPSVPGALRSGTPGVKDGILIVGSLREIVVTRVRVVREELPRITLMGRLVNIDGADDGVVDLRDDRVGVNEGVPLVAVLEIGVDGVSMGGLVVIVVAGVMEGALEMGPVVDLPDVRIGHVVGVKEIGRLVPASPASAEVLNDVGVGVQVTGVVVVGVVGVIGVGVANKSRLVRRRVLNDLLRVMVDGVKCLLAVGCRALEVNNGEMLPVRMAMPAVARVGVVGLLDMKLVIWVQDLK